MMEATGPDGTSVLPKARKTRAVLAMLALASPRPALRGRLTHLLWSSRGNEQARASLRQAWHELQEALGSVAGTVLWADRHHLAVRDGSVWVDVHELLQASASTPEVLDMLRGQLLEDLEGLDPAFDIWLATERVRLRARARELGESVLDVQDEPDAVLGAAQRLLSIDPAHEGAWRATIETHLRRGDRGAAVVAFDRCRAALATSSGLPPPEDLALRIAEVRQRGTQPADPGIGGATEPQPSVRREGGIRLGVMPMRMLNAADEDPLAVGLAEEITAAFSRFRWISCVASSSVAAAAKQPDDSLLWNKLGLDFMLEGTVQRNGGRVRVTTRLLDMREQGTVIWASKFDREMTDILTLQEEIAAETVAQVDPELLLREGERAGARPSLPDPTAYELMLRAIPGIFRLERTGFMAAGDMLRAAIAIDTAHAASHAWLAYWHLLLVGQGWADDPNEATVQSASLADRTVTLDPTDSRGLTLSGHVRAFLGRRPDEGLFLHQRALALNPNLPMAWAFCGLSHSYLGQHEEAIRHIGQAKRLSPFDPHGFFFESALCVALLLNREHEAALQTGRRAIELNPGFSAVHKSVLAILGHLGRTADASLILSRLMLIEPRLTLQDAIARAPFLNSADLAHYAEGLRRGGLT
jgi:DNA-binding SARP family transcriptional activator/TolB-like protein